MPPPARVRGRKAAAAAARADKVRRPTLPPPPPPELGGSASGGVIVTEDAEAERGSLAGGGTRLKKSPMPAPGPALLPAATPSSLRQQKCGRVQDTRKRPACNGRRQNCRGRQAAGMLNRTCRAQHIQGERFSPVYAGIGRQRRHKVRSAARLQLVFGIRRLGVSAQHLAAAAPPARQPPADHSQAPRQESKTGGATSKQVARRVASPDVSSKLKRSAAMFMRQSRLRISYLTISRDPAMLQPVCWYAAKDARYRRQIWKVPQVYFRHVLQQLLDAQGSAVLADRGTKLAADS